MPVGGGDLLGRFGISADAEAVWLALLDLGHVSVTELADSLHQGRGQTEAHVAELSEAQLVATDPNDGLLHALDPTVAVQAQISRTERELCERLEELHEIRTQLPALSKRHARSQTVSSGTVGFQVVRNQPEIQRQLHLLAEQVMRLVRSMSRQATADTMRAGHASTEQLALRGVEQRTLVASDFLADRDRFAESLIGNQLGDRHRSLPELPTHMIIFDDNVVVLPVDPEDVNLGAIFIRERGVIEPMTALFDHLWAIAQPVFAENAADMTLAVRTSRVLELVAAGATDTNISRSLGVTTRTVRREVATLRDTLGVGSRIEIVPAAIRRGWL